MMFYIFPFVIICLGIALIFLGVGWRSGHKKECKMVMKNVFEKEF